MDDQEIEALEPKYTGNQRHLTEGEAEAIVHDPNFSNSEDEEITVFDALAIGAPYSAARKS